MMTTIHTPYELERLVADDYECIDLDVEFEITPFRPAVLYGDYPSAAEGGEIEITGVTLKGSKEQFALTDDEEKALYAWIEDQDWSDDMGPDPDYQRDMREGD